MLSLYYGPGACSMAVHILLEESGEKYESLRMDLQLSKNAWQKVHSTLRIDLAALDLPIGS